MNKFAFGSKSKRFLDQKSSPRNADDLDDLFLSGNQYKNQQIDPVYFRPKPSPNKPKEAEIVPKISHWDNSFQKSYESNLPPKKIYTTLRANLIKFIEIPHLLDGFLILNNAQTDDPKKVISLNLSRKNLKFVVEEDLLMFENLDSLDLSENDVPFARIGIFPRLTKLNLSCNKIKGIDLDVDGRFLQLKCLNLSFNRIDLPSQIVLASLPSLNYLDLSKNGITTMASQILDMSNWKDDVIELLLLPSQVSELQSLRISQVSSNTTLCCGFKMLETLILDLNDIGSSLNTWRVLSKLPLLSKLSMNRCNIPNLDFILPNGLKKLDIFGDCQSFGKTDGFQNLQVLHLTHNEFEKETDISPIVCLPKLENIYLEGNPIAIRHFHSKTGNEGRSASLN